MMEPHDDCLRDLKAEFQSVMEERAALRREHAMLRKILMAHWEQARQVRVRTAELRETLRKRREETLRII